MSKRRVSSTAETPAMPPASSAPAHANAQPARGMINTIQQASAGTGKTFALSNRYLGLMARGVACDLILAITFTRKGAGEILDRIIQRLTLAARDEMESQKLSKFIGVALDRQAVLQLLRHLTQRLHRLQIGTIDSYFYRIAQNFTAELGLPFDWEIADELALEDTKYTAIESMLADGQVTSLLHLISNADADRKVGQIIQQTVDAIYQVNRESAPEAWRTLSEFQRPAQEQLQELVQRGRALVGDKSIYGKWQQLLDAAALGDWETLYNSTIIQRAAEGNFVYNRPIPDELIPPLRELTELVSQYYCWELDCRNAAALELVAQYSRTLLPRQLYAGQLRFDDITWLLSRWTQDHHASFIARIDQVAEHLLLDEFQDTSPEQWRVIEPIADQVTRQKREHDQSGTFFCVGDRKQAIYGWRGGVAAIFDVVAERLQDRLLPSDPLVESYRSSPVVIDTVNRVFGNIAAAGSRNDFDKKVLQEWQHTFPTHATAKVNYPGWAELIQTPPAEKTADPASLHPVLSAALTEIERAFHAHPSTSIGVLLRTNDPIATLRHQLQLRGIPASEEGGNPLTDSVAVNIVLAAATLLDHPLDGPSRFLLSHSPLASAFSFLPETCQTQAHNLQQVHRAAAGWRRKIGEWGFAAVIELWARELAQRTTQREVQRLQQLLDLTLDADPLWSDRPSRFAEFIRQQKVIDAASARVRIMTVHASKGLEFDVVIAPLFNTKSGWSTRSPDFVFARPKPDQPFHVVTRHVSSEYRQFLPPAVRRAFELSEQDTVQGELCVLYVLLTRAAHQLTMIVPAQARRDQYSPAGVLLATLPQFSQNADTSTAAAQTLSVAGTSPDSSAISTSGAGKKSRRPSSRSTKAMASEESSEATHTAANAIDRQDPSAADPTEIPAAQVLYHSGDRDWANKWLQQQAANQLAPTSGTKFSSPDSLDNFYELPTGLTHASLATSAHVPTNEAVAPQDDGLPARQVTTTVKSFPTQPMVPSQQRTVAARLGQRWTTGDQRKSQRHGQWLHACFECVEWLENPPSDHQLRGILKAQGTSARQATAIIREFRELCERKSLREMFLRETTIQRIMTNWFPASRPLIEPLRLLVQNERRYCVNQGQGQWFEGIIDRLLLVYEGSRLVAVELYDLKTEQIPVTAVPARVAIHRPQVLAYRQAARTFLRLDSSQPIASWLIFSGCDQVVEIGDSFTET